MIKKYYIQHKRIRHAMLVRFNGKFEMRNAKIKKKKKETEDIAISTNMYIQHLSSPQGPLS